MYVYVVFRRDFPILICSNDFVCRFGLILGSLLGYVFDIFRIFSGSQKREPRGISFRVFMVLPWRLGRVQGSLQEDLDLRDFGRGPVTLAAVLEGLARRIQRRKRRTATVPWEIWLRNIFQPCSHPGVRCLARACLNSAKQYVAEDSRCDFL